MHRRQIVDLLQCMEVICLIFSYKRYWELKSVVGETLAACGVSCSVLDELLAMNRIMPHNVGVAAATDPATELKNNGGGKVTN